MERVVKVNNLDLDKEGQNGREDKEDGQNDGGDKKLFFQTAFGVPSGCAGLTPAKSRAKTPLALLQQNRADQQDGQNNLRVRQNRAQSYHC